MSIRALRRIDQSVFDRRVRGVLRTAAILVMKSWTQGSAARNRAGHMVHATQETACCWCMAGALVRAAHDNEATGRVYRRAVQVVAASVTRRWDGSRNFIEESVLANYNDTPCRTARQVAIELRVAALGVTDA